VAERCPHVRHVAIEGAGHYVHDDAPEAFHGTVRIFLEAQP